MLLARPPPVFEPLFPQHREVTITAERAQPSKGSRCGCKSVFVDPVTGTPQSVELVALAHYLASGRWTAGLHSENGVFRALFVLLPFHSTRHWSAPVAGACMGFGLVGFIVYKVMRNRLYYTTLPVVLAEHITELNVMYSGRGLRFGLEKTSEYNAPFDLVIQLPTTHTLHAAYVAPQRQSSSTSPPGTEAEAEARRGAAAATATVTDTTTDTITAITTNTATMKKRTTKPQETAGTARRWRAGCAQG